jgi:phage-related protein (TIGR01555 family)
MKTKADQIFEKPKRSKTGRVVDGFANFAAKLGVNPNGWGGTEDNLISKGFYQFNLLTRNRIQLEAAYRGSWIVGRVVDCTAQDMTRAGIELTTNDAAEDVPQIHVQMSRLQIWQSLCDLIKWGRLYGGAIAVIQIKGQQLDKPLDPDTISEGQFQGLVVYDRWQLNPVLTEIIDSGPEMGLPKFYDIVLGSNLNDPGQISGGQETTNPSGQVRVHHTRCIRYDGIKLPFFQAITEMMWAESILERMWDRLIEFDTATAATSSLIMRAQLRTVGIDGLREILAGGGQAQEALIAQFEYMRQLQNNEGITLLDKEDTFASTAYSFAGLSDTLLQLAQQVAGAAETPLVVLFGQSPAGMNATGESDIRLYYDMIKAQQEAKLRNPVEMLLKVLWRSVLGENVPEDLEFDFTPLWQMSALDQAAVSKSNTETIIAAHDAGAIDTQTMMKELKQSSGDTGLFTHIADEAINDAENEEPPAPEEQDLTLKPGETAGEPGAGPAEPKEQLQKDSAWSQFFKRKLK